MRRFVHRAEREHELGAINLATCQSPICIPSAMQMMDSLQVDGAGELMRGTAIRVDRVKKLAQVASCVGQLAESRCHGKLRGYPPAL